MRKTFDDYHRKWLKHTDYKFPEEFLEETREVFDMLVQRIEREEQVLFPKAGRDRHVSGGPRRLI